MRFTANGKTVTSHSKNDSFGRKEFEELQLGTGFVSRQFSYLVGDITDLRRENGKYDLAVLDIHAEATGEKLALARYFDSRFAAIFGTHTHVPTADEQILPRGTGYVTDIGMCGGSGGVIGVKAEVIIERYLTALPVRSEPDDSPVKASGALFTVDTETKKCLSVERITLE